MTWFEVPGEIPLTHRSLVIAMINKRICGLRPVGLYRGLFRARAMARRGFVQDWQDDFGGHHAFASRGGKAVDIVWRQAARYENSKNECHSAPRHPVVLRDGISLPSLDQRQLVEIPPQYFEDVTPIPSVAQQNPSGTWFPPSSFSRGRGVVTACVFPTTELRGFLATSISHHARQTCALR